MPVFTCHQAVYQFGSDVGIRRAKTGIGITIMGPVDLQKADGKDMMIPCLTELVFTHLEQVDAVIKLLEEIKPLLQFDATEAAKVGEDPAAQKEVAG